jgi:hypothetical protein
VTSDRDGENLGSNKWEASRESKLFFCFSRARIGWRVVGKMGLSFSAPIRRVPHPNGADSCDVRVGFHKFRPLRFCRVPHTSRTLRCVGFYVTGMRLDTQTNSAVRDLAAVKTRRYHSLIVAEKDLPDDLAVSAWTHDADGTRVIMACATASFQ